MSWNEPGDVSPIESRGRTHLTRDNTSGNDPDTTHEQHHSSTSDDWNVPGQTHDTEMTDASWDRHQSDRGYYTGEAHEPVSPIEPFDDDDDEKTGDSYHQHGHDHEHDVEPTQPDDISGNPLPPTDHKLAPESDWDTGHRSAFAGDELVPETYDYDSNITQGGRDDRFASKWDEDPEHKHVSDTHIGGKKSDSTIGKLMEKAGDVLHSDKIAEKGREKREVKAEEKAEKVGEKDEEEVGSSW